jgi:hypothetical protein
MKKVLAVALFLMLALAPALAQDAASDNTPATKEDIDALFVTMHIREQMRNMMDLMAKQSKQMGMDSLKKKMPDISQKDLDRMDAMMDRVLKDFDVNGMIDDMVPVYQRHLTRADVAAMAAFYKTPTGQKMLREQPQMAAEAMKAVQPRMEKMMSQVMDEAEKMAKESAAESKDSENKTAK